MSYTIIIPSRNGSNLMFCARYIRATGCKAHIVVVDDCEAGDPSWTPEDIEEISGEELYGAKPFCFARNVNRGIQAVGKDDVIVMNDDALLVAGSFNALSVHAQTFPDFGIVSAAVRGPVNSMELQPLGDGLRPISGKMVPFVCVYIPRRTIDRVGLLDERFCGVYGGEDDDYCLRVRRAGLKIGVYDGCVVDHGTLPSTFRPDGKGLSTKPARDRFREIYGFEMGSR